MPIQMNLRAPFLFSSYLLILHCTLPGQVVSQKVSFYVSNKCPFTIWPAAAPNTGHPILADGGFILPSGQGRHIQAPLAWSGRFWARTGCSFKSNNSQQRACQTGDCDGRLTCNGIIGLPPVTLVEISLGSDPTKLDYFDMSLVDGYNLPVSISSNPVTKNCHIGGCSKNLNNVCPQELVVKNESSDVVACKSACLAFDHDLFCCRNEYGSPEKCRPNVYSSIFKDACPSYFSYAFDSPMPLVKCNAKEYVITFCPSKWGVISLVT